jgi:GT2 family glycosyltransferase
MALIAMAVYDTSQNGRTKYTQRTINSLKETVDFNVHRLVIVDNGSCEETKEFLKGIDFAQVITLPENIGTAKGINKAWELRQPNEHLIKMDNDVEIYYTNWVDELEEAIERDTNIGIIGLKRKDLMENPFRNDMFKSELKMLPHQNGDRWIIVEKVDHVIGTCQMFNHRLIKKIGGLVQPGVYGFDDTLAAVRCKVAGFYSCFLPHIEIDHIDVDENPYWQEKRTLASADMDAFHKIKDEYLTGKKSIYHLL